MSAQDWKLLQRRRSCNLLTHAEMETTKTPTTPTISSIIAGVQCQEAVKLLHGMSTLSGAGWVFNGISGESYVTQFQRKKDCYSHDRLDKVIALDARAAETSASELLEIARRELGNGATLELPREMLEKLVCPACGDEQPIHASLGQVPATEAWCPRCRSAGNDNRRHVVTFHRIRGDEAWANRPLAQIGVPPFDILIARRPGDGRSLGLELSGDATEVLANLISTSDALELEAI